MENNGIATTNSSLSNLPAAVFCKSIAEFLTVQDLLQLSRCNHAVRCIIFDSLQWTCHKDECSNRHVFVPNRVGDNCRDCQMRLCRDCISYHCLDCNASSCGCEEEEFPECAVCDEQRVFCTSCATYCCECGGHYCPDCTDGNECVGSCNYCGERPCSSSCGGEGKEDGWCHICYNYYCSTCKSENQFTSDGKTFFGPCEVCHKVTCDECNGAQCMAAGEEGCLNMVCSKCYNEEEAGGDYVCKVHREAANNNDMKP